MYLIDTPIMNLTQAVFPGHVESAMTSTSPYICLAALAVLALKLAYGVGNTPGGAPRWGVGGVGGGGGGGWGMGVGVWGGGCGGVGGVWVACAPETKFRLSLSFPGRVTHCPPRTRDPGSPVFRPRPRAGWIGQMLASTHQHASLSIFHSARMRRVVGEGCGRGGGHGCGRGVDEGVWTRGGRGGVDEGWTSLPS